MTRKPMAGFKLWDIVKVPFPYTDRPVRQHRPALIAAAGDVQAAHGLVWVLMITSAENRGWDGDVAISNLDMAGLPAPSVVRCAKIATIDMGAAEYIGHLPRADQQKAAKVLARILAPASGG